MTAFIEQRHRQHGAATVLRHRLRRGRLDLASRSAAAGQRDTSQSGFTVAGSVTLGRLTHNIKAYLGDGAVVHADDVVGRRPSRTRC